MVLTEAEQNVLKAYIQSLSADQIAALAIQFIPLVIEQGLYTPTPLINNLTAKSAGIQATIDGLDAVKTANQATLTAQKSVIDSLLTKLQSI